MGAKIFMAIFLVLQLVLEPSEAHRAAIVANGLECAAIARYVCQK